MKVSSILNVKGDDVFSVSPDETMRKTLQLFAEKQIGCAPVKDMDGRTIGLISERDICHVIANEGESAVNSPVSTGLRKKIIKCTPDDHQATAMALMTAHRTRHVLVMDEDKIVGIISIGDIVKHRLDAALKDEQSMRDYIAGTGYSYQMDA